MELDMWLYNRICEITNTEYDAAKTNDEESVLATHDLDTMIENLVSAYDYLEEQYKDLQHDVRDNYKPIQFDPYEEYGINEKDFH